MRGALALMVVCGTAHAYADDDPVPAPAESSWYGGAQLPAASPDVRIRHPVMRDGVFVLGGTTRVNGETFGRLDLGLPTPTKRIRVLRTLLVTELGSTTEQSIERRTLSIAPTLQVEWRLQISLASGELLIVTAAGIQRSQVWEKRPDEPFWPANWESITAYSVRFIAGVEYRSRKGLVVSAQPLVQFPFGEPESPDPRWIVMDRQTAYGAAVVAGYQLK